MSGGMFGEREIQATLPPDWRANCAPTKDFLAAAGISKTHQLPAAMHRLPRIAPGWPPIRHESQAVASRTIPALWPVDRPDRLIHPRLPSISTLNPSLARTSFLEPAQTPFCSPSELPLPGLTPLPLTCADVRH